MKIIVPMAGMGKRMRPHTLTVPKPLIPIAGKPIVHRLVEDIAKVCAEPVEEVAFIIGRSFGKEVEQDLIKIAESVGGKGTICYQDEALGTAHAILCAQSALDGHVVVAFADTLFKADFTLDTNVDGTIWVQSVEDPKPFGVVKLDDAGQITDFVEKPQTFVSDLAIIGIYYFKDGEYLKRELQYLLDNNIMDKGEYQLTNALEALKAKGTKFRPGEVEEWLDCGNKTAVVHTHARVLTLKADAETLVDPSAEITDSVLIAPCYIGPGAKISNSVVGPYVSLGAGSAIVESVVRNSIIQDKTTVTGANVADSMIGANATYLGTPADVSAGDYSEIQQ